MDGTTMETPMTEPFALSSQMLGALPIVDCFLSRMRVDTLLARWLPAADARVALEPAKAIGLLVRNLCVSREPIYALGEWAAPFDPALLGMTADDVALLNDDRVGRALDQLFDADRASLLTELMLGVIGEFTVDCSQLHNDSTSITLTGAYRCADGHARAGKPTPAAAHGHNKDHRPDLKQLSWILTVSADEAVPVAHRLSDGNTGDDQTHIATWDELRAIVGRADFLYVADCKLCTREQMTHIDANGGRFVTVLPRSRREDGFLRDWAHTHQPDWTEALRRPGAHRRPRRDVAHRAGADQLGGGPPDRLGALQPEDTQRRRHPPAAHRARPARPAGAQPAPRRPQKPASRSRHRRAGRGRRDHGRPSRALDHRDRHRNDRTDAAPREARPTRQGHPLPQDHPNSLARRAHHQRRQRRPRRRKRRLLPADQQRPPAHRPRAARRLPLPAQPRKAPPPAQERPARRPRADEEPRAHRSALLLPVHRAAVLLLDRTRPTPRDAPRADRRPAALPRAPRLRPADRRPRTRALRRTRAPPPHQPRRPARPDLPTPAHRSATAAPAHARPPRQRLHRLTSRHRPPRRGGAYAATEVRNVR